ncbi:hypothetical protein IW144_006322 [Coemansia sp. RSA 522]|nr:hypothetical protein J3F82_006335 [Coemansia sp. RSA 637]KAJ2186152.1 hypothetical protein IW144_006322 [Coemansia sp. RSA 522]KAJ2264282.1 hypothetical protein J3F81_006294 [Coemansia sp. RSA 371]
MPSIVLSKKRQPRKRLLSLPLSLPLWTRQLGLPSRKLRLSLYLRFQLRRLSRLPLKKQLSRLQLRMQLLRLPSRKQPSRKQLPSLPWKNRRLSLSSKLWLSPLLSLSSRKQRLSLLSKLQLSVLSSLPSRKQLLCLLLMRRLLFQRLSLLSKKRLLSLPSTVLSRRLSK